MVYPPALPDGGGDDNGGRSSKRPPLPMPLPTRHTGGKSTGELRFETRTLPGGAGHDRVAVWLEMTPHEMKRHLHRVRAPLALAQRYLPFAVAAEAYEHAAVLVDVIARMSSSSPNP